MSEAPRQLVLDLPHRSALGAEDYLVSPANTAAVDLIDRWPRWTAPALLVCGPAGSGKSHLVSVWRSRSGAPCLPYADLDDAAVELVGEGGALAVEDVDRAPGPERVLFHILNSAREARGTVLVTSRRPAGEIDIALPDLRSRLRALPTAAIAPPDDALLNGLLVKLFSDRQLAVEPAVVAYLIRHMERSADTAVRLVAEIDQLALATRKPITRNLVSRVLARYSIAELPDN